MIRYGSYWLTGIVCLCLPPLSTAAPAADTPAAAERPVDKRSNSAQDVPSPAKEDGEPLKSGEERSVAELTAESRQSVVVISVTGRDGRQQGLGTGFVIGDDLIATNLHVVGEARPIEVQTFDGRKLPVTAVHASDHALDLALLQVDTGQQKLKPLPLGDTSQSLEGSSIVVLGNPHGLQYSVVAGVISATREMEGRRMLQLAVPIEPGNSGGPVLDRQGKVLGIVTMKSLVNDNLGFAVAIDHLQPLIDKPNPVPMERWLTIGTLDARRWRTLFGARWQQRAGRIRVEGAGEGFGGRSLCLWHEPPGEPPYEVAVDVRLEDESGAAGLVFHADGDDKHYGFYPSNGRLRLSRFEGPNVFTWQVLQEVDSSAYRPEQWNHLKVRVERDGLRCYVNDQLVIESEDQIYTSGKVGLAKFRDTVADFKNFQVAEQIAPSQLPSDTVAELRALVEALPHGEAFERQQLEPLVERSAASVRVLRDEADRLERRAAELRQYARDIHAADAVRQLTETLQQQPVPLLRAALLVARLDDEELDVEAYVDQVRQMAEAIRKRLPEDAAEEARKEALHKYLFQDNGFHGSRTDYYHQANSYLNRVIDDREGLPITLSVLYIELGKQLDLNLEGVGLPGHFVVRYLPAEGDSQLIDVFEQGKELTRAEAELAVRHAHNQPLTDEHLTAYTEKEIVLRMLRNLLGIAQSNTDRAAMLRYLDAMIAIDPQLARERGLRAVLHYETGRRAQAVAELQWFLEQKPAGIDLEAIRRMQQAWQQTEAR